MRRIKNTEMIFPIQPFRPSLALYLFFSLFFSNYVFELGTDDTAILSANLAATLLRFK